MRTPSTICRLAIASAMAIVATLSFAATNDSTPSVDSTPLAQDDFTSTLAADLTAHFSLDGELQMELGHAWSPPNRMARAWRVQIMDYPTLPSSSMLIRYRIVADGAVAADTTVMLRACLWRDVWVVHQPPGIGSVFDRSILEVRRVDTFRERDVVPSSVGDSTFIFLRSVQAGHFLTWHDIGRRPLVRKGDLVDVTANEGALSLSMKALAMQNGAQGEAVTVRNLDSRKEFTAVVVDENHVQIRF